jgi:hypothetical protein
MILASAIIGFFTLVAALFAAGFAWRASEENKKSNILSEQESRPTMMPDGYEIGGIGQDRALRFKWKNIGKSSARIVSGASYRHVDTGDDDIRIWGKGNATRGNPNAKDKPGEIIPAGGTHYSAWMIMTRVDAGEVAVFVLGRLAYTSAIAPRKPWVSENVGTVIWLKNHQGIEVPLWEALPNGIQLT